MKILFMCVANSARSQLAEGLAKRVFGDKAWVESAGSRPKTVNPYAVRALREIGIEIDRHFSKSYDQLPPAFVVDLDYIITLCAEEVCPVVASRTAKKLHWPFPDPAGHEGDDEAQMSRFRETRDRIKERLEAFRKECFGS